jgi:hypothetical protein
VTSSRRWPRNSSPSGPPRIDGRSGRRSATRRASHVLSARDLTEALDATFRIVDRCLDGWTIGMLDEVLRRPDWDDSWVHTRGSVIQRVFSHDVYHVAEVNEVLGAAGLAQVDLWD